MMPACPRSRRSDGRTRSFVLVLAVLAWVAPMAALASPLKIGGTGADLGTMKELAVAFRERNPEFSFDILPSLGSGGGIKAVLAGAIDLAIIAQPLKKEERDAGARDSAYARTPLVIAVHAADPHGAIGFRDLVDIVSGAKRTWPDGRPVRLILRNQGDSDVALLERYVPGMKAALAQAYARKAIVIAYSDQDNADRLEAVPDALGITSLSVIQGERRRLKPLALEGAAPTPESVVSGAYPIVKTLRFVTRGEPDGGLARFLAFVGSAEGRAILERTGHAPLDGGPSR